MDELIYPNSNRFTLSLPAGFHKIEISDFKGRLIFTQAVSTTESQQEIKTALLPGVYLCRFLSGNAVVIRKVILD